MKVIPFDGSFEELSATLAQHAAHAMEHVSDSQRNIRPGEFWVRFHDLDASPPIIEFGRVLTREEIALSMLEDGIEWSEVVDFVTTRDDRRANLGMLYGEAHSLLGEDGAGETHCSYVWPIEDRLFQWAKVRGWDVSLVDDEIDGALWIDNTIDAATGRFLLELAFRSMRTHYIPDYKSADAVEKINEEEK